jgi:hypothetical protein
MDGYNTYWNFTEEQEIVARVRKPPNQRLQPTALRARKSAAPRAFSLFPGESSTSHPRSG